MLWGDTYTHIYTGWTGVFFSNLTDYVTMRPMLHEPYSACQGFFRRKPIIYLVHYDNNPLLDLVHLRADSTNLDVLLNQMNCRKDLSKCEKSSFGGLIDTI